MKSYGLIAVLIAGLLAGPAVYAQQASAPAGAPAGSTGQCKDGTFTTNATKKGACSGHQGVKEWFGAASTATPTAPAAAPAAAAAPSMTPRTTAPVPNTKEPSPAPATAAAPGGGPGMVWVNSSSKVYHCPSDKWYGKTKAGVYMSEADAKAKGFHADHGKACS
jgi:hypothetical protein